MSLKTSNWLDVVEKEISLCSSNTIPLADANTSSPDYNCLGIPEIPARPRSPPGGGPPAKPPPPSRPPLPKSPAATPKHQPHLPRVGVISVTPELMGKGKPVLSPTTSLPPLKPAPAPQMMMHYDVPGSPQRRDMDSGAGSSAIYEEIADDDVSIEFFICRDRLIISNYLNIYIF